MSRREVWVRPITTEELRVAKRSFATRRVPTDAMRTVIGGAVRPRSGDVVLAKVTRPGNHRNIEQPNGRRSKLHEDDLIIVAYADRYATDQYESYVPTTLGRTNLVASGGIASEVASRSGAVRNATEITPLGLLGGENGRPINVEQFALPRVAIPAQRPRTVAVIGTSMNAGKTTTIHYLLHGLAKAGMRPGATKVTGTGSGNDYWVMLDAGAHAMLDFTDAGLASTFQHSIPRLEDAMQQLISHLTLSGCGLNLVEIADGVFQQETSALLESDTFKHMIDAVILAGGDAMGAALGVQHLRERNLPVVAVSGLLTKSPLAAREARVATGLPVLGLDDLLNPEVVFPLVGLDLADIRVTEPAPEAWPITLEGHDEALPTNGTPTNGTPSDGTQTDGHAEPRRPVFEQAARVASRFTANGHGPTNGGRRFVTPVPVGA